jgi:hypothetical protein
MNLEFVCVRVQLRDASSVRRTVMQCADCSVQRYGLVLVVE